MTIIDDPAQPALVRASAIERLGRMPRGVVAAVADARHQRSGPAGAACGGRGDRRRRRCDARPLSAENAERSRARCKDRGGACACRAAGGALPAADRDAFAKALGEYIAVQNLQRGPARRPDEPRRISMRRAAMPSAPPPNSARRSKSIPPRSKHASTSRISIARDGTKRKRRPSCARESQNRRARPRCITRSASPSCAQNAPPTACASSAKPRSSRRTTRDSLMSMPSRSMMPGTPRRRCKC